MTPSLFFIIGRGRSGSWLLRSVLSAHPEISVAPEALFIVHTMRKYGRIRSFSRRDIRGFSDAIWREGRISLWWGVEKRRLLESLLEQGEGRSFSELCTEVHAEYARQAGKESAGLLVGDKNPTNTLFISELAACFSESKFIALVRDFRDNILSYQKVAFDLQGTGVLAQRWKDYNREILRHQDPLGERLLILRYEDLVGRPERSVSELCSFLGVCFNPKMLAFHETRVRPETPAFPWTANTMRPIDPNLAWRWMAEMDSWAAARAESVCADVGAHFGYRPQKRNDREVWSVANIRCRIGGRTATILERLLFRLPSLRLRMWILDGYRYRTGSLQKDRSSDPTVMA